MWEFEEGKLKKAIDYVKDIIMGRKEWPHTEPKKPDWKFFPEIFRRAFKRYGDDEYADAACRVSKILLGEQPDRKQQPVLEPYMLDLLIHPPDHVECPEVGIDEYSNGVTSPPPV